MRLGQLFTSDGRRVEQERGPEAGDRPPVRPQEMAERSNNFTARERPVELVATIGAIAGKLPLLMFLATFVFIIVILYWGQTVLVPVAFALLLTFLLSPLVDGLDGLRLGRIPSVMVIDQTAETPSGRCRREKARAARTRPMIFELSMRRPLENYSDWNEV